MAICMVHGPVAPRHLTPVQACVATLPAHAALPCRLCCACRTQMNTCAKFSRALTKMASGRWGVHDIGLHL